jgi:predicted phage terminase large subunit-like protein
MPVDRNALIRQVEQQQAENDAFIRRQVLENGRIDILAVEVLGYQIKPFHRALQRHMLTHSQTLHLAFRGGGKSTVLTVVGAVFDVIRNPNVRICIASKTEGHAKKILSEIKQHFESNEKFRRIFGDLVGDTKWDQTEIIVQTRTRAMKEPTIMAVGIGGQVTGSHFDVIYGDDLVDEDNSRTRHGRMRTKTWYYTALDPTLEPDGRRHIIGTRYHYDDLYGHLEANEMSETTQIIRALDSKGRSPWPEKFPATYFRKKRQDLGLIIFASQYLCDTQAMQGEVFRYDDIDMCDEGDVPDEGRGAGGVDLAIKTAEANDRYAEAFVKVTEHGDIYVLSSFTKHLRFSQQTDRITGAWQSGADGWFGVESESDLVEIGIETNAYQDAQYQTLEETVPGIRLYPVTTIKDKYTRALKLSNYFERGKVHVVGRQPELVEQLVLFPNADFDDLFDALDIAITTAFRRRKKRGRRRRGRVGVI